MWVSGCVSCRKVSFSLSKVTSSHFTTRQHTVFAHTHSAMLSCDYQKTKRKGKKRNSTLDLVCWMMIRSLSDKHKTIFPLINLVSEVDLVYSSFTVMETKWWFALKFKLDEPNYEICEPLYADWNQQHFSSNSDNLRHRKPYNNEIVLNFKISSPQNRIPRNWINWSDFR